VNPAPSAATRLVALLGDPVSHSLSPRFQNAAFRAAGVDGVYLALRCDAAIVAPLLRGIAAAGGAGNVTIPHKAAAAAALDRPATAVQRTGACNTFWYEDGRVCGDNTDVAGIGRALQELAGGEAAGARVLLIGAGGAASAALCALRDAGADEVVVLNRTADRAAALASRYRGETVRIATADDAHALRGERFDIAVSARTIRSPSGRRPTSGSTVHSTWSMRPTVPPGFASFWRAASRQPTESPCCSTRGRPPSSGGGGFPHRSV
jgi:shikimate dehydrogenase